jgi:hypothetical protein
VDGLSHVRSRFAPHTLPLHTRILALRDCAAGRQNNKAPEPFGPGAKLRWAFAARSCRCSLLGALAFAGRGLPDATLRGMRMFRSHGGTVPTVTSRNLLSEASSPGSDASCRKLHAGRGAGTPAIFRFASAPLPRGRHRLLADRSPRVTGLTSSLSGCIGFCSGVMRFVAPPRFEKGGELCQVRSLPAVPPPLRVLLQ